MQTKSAQETTEIKEPAPASGCYAIRYTRVYSYLEPDVLHYDGTLRITRENARGELDQAGTIVKASADLYDHPAVSEQERAKQQQYSAKLIATLPPGEHACFPMPAERHFRIPIFHRALYRFYLQGLDVNLQNGSVERPASALPEFLFRFRVHEFDQSAKKFETKGTCVALMKALENGAAPRIAVRPPTGKGAYEDGQTDDKLEYEGEVINEDTGAMVGKLLIHWISDQDHMREAEVELDSVHSTPQPMNNKPSDDPCTWEKAFNGTGWKIYPWPDNSKVSQPKRNGSTGIWSVAELHHAMLDHRDRSKHPDEQWAFYLLCVPRIAGYDRGVMYDGYEGDGADADSEDRELEGAAIASDWKFVKAGKTDDNGNVEKTGWGKAVGPISKTPAYFRCAVHEIGHAMGLEHNHADEGFMNTTDAIRASDVASFPINIKWRFHVKDQERLRHGPDVKVRPGTVVYDNEPIFGDREKRNAEGLKLHLTPLLETVPYGAPVRLHLKLENTTSEPRLVPANFRSKSGLSLSSGHLIGKITDPSGTVRTFSPIVMPMDAERLEEIGPGTTDSHAVTLLRGPQGALFPLAGVYRISIELSWDEAGILAVLNSQTEVAVSAPRDDLQRRAARGVFATPQTLLSLAIGGDHLDAGQSAIDAALQSPALRPHFEIIIVKRLARLYRDRPRHLDEACEELDDATVLSVAEIKRILDLLGWPPPKKQRDKVEAKDALKIKSIPNAASAIAVLTRKVEAMVANGKIEPKDQVVDDLHQLSEFLKGPVIPQIKPPAAVKPGKDQKYNASKTDRKKSSKRFVRR